ncbi:hypothetical protein PRNP1_001557 [Phytophthora ramorum]
MMSLKLQSATDLVIKYVASASSDNAASSPLQLTRCGFGTAVGRSWPLSPCECWVRLDVVTRNQIDVALPQTGKATLAQQLQARRSLLELICQLVSTASCRWEENFELLWWPAVLRPTDFKNEKYLETVQGVGSSPKFMLSMGRPMLENVHMFFQFLQMGRRGLLEEEDWQLLKRLRMEKRGETRVEIGMKLANNVVDTAILRSMVLAMQEYFIMEKRTSETEREDLRVDYQVTALWFHNSRFLNAAEDLSLLARIITLPSSTIRTLMLPGVFFNSLRNPAGLGGFQSFVKQVLVPSSSLRSLDLTRTGIDSNCVAALCSALRYSAPLTKLSIGHTIRGAHTNSRLVWAWIFLAVFHVDSGSELEHFDVSGLQLQKHDVEILTTMMESPHPGRTVVLMQDGRLPEGEGCGERALPPGERLFVRLLDGSQAWTSPGYSAAWPQLLPGALQADGFEYEVMVRLADWLCILIPGHGFGWVVSSAVRYEVVKPSHVTATLAAKPRPGLKSFTYRGLDAQSNGVVDLLRIIGSSLTSLDVPSCRLNSQDLDIILRACPNLSSLNVTGNLVTDLSPLLHAYEEGRCQVAKLGVFVESVNAIIAGQLQVLLVGCKCLESLQLDTIGSGADSDSSEHAIWTEIERALSSNTTLRCLHLALPSGNTHEVATELIKPFHGQILRFETPVKLKAAFLSVVEHASSSQSMSSLDHMILSSVLSFATTSAIRRHVSIRR